MGYPKPLHFLWGTSIPHIEVSCGPAPALTYLTGTGLEAKVDVWEGSQELPRQARQKGPFLSGPYWACGDGASLSPVFCHLPPSPHLRPGRSGLRGSRVSLGETFSSTLWLPNPQRWINCTLVNNSGTMIDVFTPVFFGPQRQSQGRPG